MASLLPNVSPFLMIMISTLLLISCYEAREFLVGGSEDSWKVPPPSPDSLNQWAERQRFRIGDALIFKYDNKTESVHVVNERDYASCNRVGDHQKLKDGNSKVRFPSSGPIHFISGEEGHCEMGLKLAVVVMSSTHHGASSHQPASSPSPLPEPSTSTSPSPAPSPFALPSNNQGVAGSAGGGFIGVMTGLGVSLLMVFFTI